MHRTCVTECQTAVLVLVAVVFASGIANAGAAERDQPDVTVSSVCLLAGKDYQNRDYVLRMIAEAAGRPGSDLVVTPYMPFFHFRTGFCQQDLALFAKLAARRATYLVVAMNEVADQKIFATSVLINRQGNVVFKSRKTHALPDDDHLALGDSLKVFKTDFGIVGCTIGTDFYFPEIYEVLSRKGANVILWQHSPRAFREHSGWEALLTARAVDSQAHLVTAHYASSQPYITNHAGLGIPGTPFGRSMVVNRVGVPVADTGYKSGIATAIVELGVSKHDSDRGSKAAENVFTVNVTANRQALGPIAEPWDAPEPAEYQSRTARVAVIATDMSHVWKNDSLPTGLLTLLDAAARVHPDIVLISEQQAEIADPTTRRGMVLIGKQARKMNSYICIGGLRSKDHGSTAHLWDRDGKLVFTQPIHWPSGLEDVQVYDTDFARIGFHTCGDVFAPFIDRVSALKGAELILDPSLMWGPSGNFNETLLRARAIDNSVWIACAHWNSSDPGLRSLIIDPFGQVMASSAFGHDDVIYYDIPFERNRPYYAGRADQQARPGYLRQYWSDKMPAKHPDWQSMIFSRRRPELYDVIPISGAAASKAKMRNRPAE